MAKKKESPGLIELLKEAIRSSGQSLNQLSRKSGVSTPQLSRFMQGERSLTLPAADKICRALHLTLTPEARGSRRRKPDAGHRKPEAE